MKGLIQSKTFNPRVTLNTKIVAVELKQFLCKQLLISTSKITIIKLQIETNSTNQSVQVYHLQSLQC